MKVNQLKAGATLSYISMGLGYVILIVYTPFMLRLLGQSEYGLYNLAASVVSYLGLLSFGFGSAYVRYYYRYKVNNEQENIAKLNGMFLIVFSVIGFIAVLAGAVLVSNIKFILGEKLSMSELATAKKLVAIMVFNIAVSFPTIVFNSHITANEEYIFQKSLQMIKLVVSPFLILPVLLMGYKSVGMVVVTTALTISVEIANVVFCFKKLNIKFLFRQFDFSLMREMTVFSSYIFMNMIINQVNWNVDKFILGRFRGTVTVAVYGLALQLSTYYMLLSTAISSVFIPRVNRLVAGANDNKELTDLFTRVGRVQFIVLSLVCSGIIFFGQPFINMWAGTDYSETYPIALLLIVPTIIPLIQNLGIEIQRAKNMHQFRSWVYLFIAIGNVSLTIPLARLYGGIGAAIGTALAQIIGNCIIMNIYYHKKIGINIIYFWREIFKFIPALLIPVATGAIMMLFVDLYSIYNFLICGTCYVSIYSLSMWLFSMNAYEKKLIIQPISYLIMRFK